MVYIFAPMMETGGPVAQKAEGLRIGAKSRVAQVAQGAGTADRRPRDDYMIAGCQSPTALPDRLDHPRPFVPQHDRLRNFRVGTVGGVQAAVAHPAGHHPHPDLPPARVVDIQIQHLHGPTGFYQDRSGYLHSSGFLNGTIFTRFSNYIASHPRY